jgi:hypothetical protein
MSYVTFTARTNLAAGYISGEEYSLAFKPKEHDPEFAAIKEVSVSLSGQRETVLHRDERTWQISCVMVGSDADRMACFLASAINGATFTFDRHGTIEDDTVIADRPITCELDVDRIRRKRLGSRSDAFEFSFTILESAAEDVPLYGENYYWDLDLTRGAVPDGWTYTRTGTMYAMDDDGIFKPHAADVMPSHYDMVSGRWLGAWFGPSVTNTAQYSSDISNAVYAVTNASKSAASSVIQGGTAQLITNTDVNGQVTQSIGTYTANPDTVFVIFEQGTGTSARLGIYDITAAAYLHQTDLNYSTGVVSGTAGTGTSVNQRAVKLLDAGPNGGAVWLIAVTVTPPTAGNSRRIYLKPQGHSAAAGVTGYIHHLQIHAGHAAGGANQQICPPIVTTGSSASRGADVLKSTSVPNWWKKSAFSAGVEISVQDNLVVSSSWLLSVSGDGSTSNNNAFIDISSGLVPRVRCTTESASVASIVRAINAPGITRIAGRWEVNNFAAADSINSSVGLDTNGALFDVAAEYQVGCAYNELNQPAIYVSRALFSPQAYSDAELKAWTG